MPLTIAELPGLNANESAYLLDSGDTIIVTTTQYTPANDPGWLVLQLDVDVVDPVTLATVSPAIVSHPWSVQKAALAGGTTVDEQQALAHEKVAGMALAAIAASRMVDALPVTDTPGVPVTRDRSRA